MKYLLRVAVATAAATAGLSAQDGLLFTCRNAIVGDEQTMSVKPTSLRVIDAEDVAVVVPAVGAAVSARKFAPHDAYCTLVGDEDNNAAIWEPILFANIDALLWRHQTLGRSLRELYISTHLPVGGFVNATGPARPADVFRVLPNGQFRFFLREAQIRSAFSISAGANLDLDAITVDWDNRLIYLSLENTQTITVHNPGGPYTLNAKDGAILALRVAGWGEPVTLMANAGLMVATESEVNVMVDQSNIRDRNNTDIGPNIGDLDGLHLSNRVGTWQNNWGSWRTLMFCGETLTGGGIVNTLGQIEIINAVPMGSSVSATTGAQIGLLPSPPPNVESLNGLHLRATDGIGAFVTETPRPEIHGAGVVQVDIEGFMGPSVAVLFFDAYMMPVHPFQTVFPPLSSSFFPQTILMPIAWPWPYFFVPLDAQGIGTWSLTVPPIAARAVFQAVQASPTGFVLSTPITIECYPN